MSSIVWCYWLYRYCMLNYELHWQTCLWILKSGLVHFVFDLEFSSSLCIVDRKISVVWPDHQTYTLLCLCCFALQYSLFPLVLAGGRAARSWSYLEQMEKAMVIMMTRILVACQAYDLQVAISETSHSFSNLCNSVSRQLVLCFSCNIQYWLFCVLFLIAATQSLNN